MKDMLNKIILGDCIDVMKGMPDKCVDLTVTSPPYDNLRDYNGFLFDFYKTADELFRITKDGGAVVWIVNDATINGTETGTSFRQALYFLDIGFNLHDTMIWNKGTFTAVGSLISRYAPVFEYMFVLSKGTPKTFNPIKDRYNKCYNRKKHGTFRQKDGTTKRMSNIGTPIKEFGQRFNIWDISAEKSNKVRFHPAMFPVQLANDHIISWSKEKDIIFDPFIGSGTTAIACIANNRQFIGIEKDPEYHRLACERVEKEKLNLFDCN